MCQSLYHQACYWIACQLQHLGFQATFLLPPWPILGDGTPSPKEWCLLPRVRSGGNGNGSIMCDCSSPLTLLPSSSSSCSTSPSSSPFIAPHSATAPSLHHLRPGCPCLPGYCSPPYPPCPCPMAFGPPILLPSASCTIFRCIPPLDPALRSLEPVSGRHYYYSPSSTSHLIPAPSVSSSSSESDSLEDKWKRQEYTNYSAQPQFHDSCSFYPAYRITDFNTMMAILSVLLAIMLYFVVTQPCL